MLHTHILVTTFLSLCSTTDIWYAQGRKDTDMATVSRNLSIMTLRKAYESRLYLLHCLLHRTEILQLITVTHLWLLSPSQSHDLLVGKTKRQNLRHQESSHSGHWNSMQRLSITFIAGVFESGIIVILVQDDNIYLTYSNAWFRCLICCCHSNRIFPLLFSIKYLKSCQNSWKQIPESEKIMRLMIFCIEMFVCQYTEIQSNRLSNVNFRIKDLKI